MVPKKGHKTNGKHKRHEKQKDDVEFAHAMELAPPKPDEIL